MEKFARQAINEGVASVEDLSVGRESELYRALNLHYNKANDFEVIDSHVWREVCVCTCVCVGGLVCVCVCVSWWMCLLEGERGCLCLCGSVRCVVVKRF